MVQQAALGITIDANHGKIERVASRLPIGITLRKDDSLRVGAASVDLTFERKRDRVSACSDGGAPLTIRSKPSWA